ncbi:MAG: Fis family transcriptional regulator [Gammaproteobacteria bacterium]|nr:Fis family transcriptional regulator [Gammaproteobacteria bacterium]
MVSKQAEALLMDKKSTSLGKLITEALEEYFNKLDGAITANLYDMVISEVEPALLKKTLQHVNNNQSAAAELLGISRGTLRKKLKTYFK